jgi:hypothetical protein
MALVPTDLRDKLKTDLNNIDDPSQANNTLASSLSDYIKNNAEFEFAWVAALPPPTSTPDPVTEASGGFTSLSFSLTPSGADTYSTAMSAFAGQLIASMSSAQYNITDSGFSTSPGNMSTATNLNSINSIQVSGDNQDDALLSLATQIINWVINIGPIIPCSGSRGSYIGAGTVTSII